MRWSIVGTAIGLAISADVAVGQTPPADRMNRMIPLIQQKLPVLGVNNPAYAPGGRGGGRGRGPEGQFDTAAATTPPPAPAADRNVRRRPRNCRLHPRRLCAQQLLAGHGRAISRIYEGDRCGGRVGTDAPLVAKIPIMHGNVASTTQRLIDQLNEGQVAVEMQEVETVEEVNQAISAMRFVSKGGTRPESGFERAAAYWGMTPSQYLQKADVWPLNPNGELLISVIIESKPGIANARAIAAMPGVAVVTAGAGTLGGVFSSTDSTGRRVRDQAGFDAGVAAILAACKEFKKSCGYPANNPAEVEKLMKDGWDFLIMQRRDQAAFDAVLTGRRLSGRPTSP
jgi:4-hydroxy-2-oxoheptanedioate aldolase